MIKKTFFISLLTLTAVLVFAQTSQVEAKGHCRSRTNIQLNVGNAYPRHDAYRVRRYTQPVVVPTAVYVPQTCYRPCYMPVYATTIPTYMEEVYVTPTPRPIGLSGLSFSWNFFK